MAAVPCCLLNHVRERVPQVEVHLLAGGQIIQVCAGDGRARAVTLGDVLGDNGLDGVAVANGEVAVRVLVWPGPCNVRSGEVDAEPEALNAGEVLDQAGVSADDGTGALKACASARPATLLIAVARRKSSSPVSIARSPPASSGRTRETGCTPSAIMRSTLGAGGAKRFRGRAQAEARRELDRQAARMLDLLT